MIGAADLAMICLIALSLVIYVGEPLIRRPSSTANRHDTDDTIAHLVLQKETLYGAIRDLDFDFHTGKVDHQDYHELRQQLEREAVQLLRQLDVVDPRVVLDETIEQQVRLLRQRRTSRADDGGQGVCASCRSALEADDHFCPLCGHTVRLA